MKSKKALTLIEIIISMALLSIIFAQVFQSFRAGGNAFRSGHNKISIQASARVLGNRIARDIRMSNSAITDTVIDADAETLVIPTASGNVIYSLAVGSDQSIISRNGVAVAEHVSSVALNNNGDVVNIDIVTSNSTLNAQVNDYTLTVKAGSRYE